MSLCERIDYDEATGAPIALIGIAEDRAVQIKLNLTNLVELQAVGVTASSKVLISIL